MIQKPLSVSLIKNAVAEDMPCAVSALKALVQIPSVSCGVMDFKALDASAKCIASMLKDLEVFDKVKILQYKKTKQILGGPGIIATKRPQPGYPTVLLYAHHDVQPVGDLSKWNTDPFTPQEINGRLYGRGASDDKAGVVLHIAAIRTLFALLKERNIPELPLGLNVFIEGEEESGSATFDQFILNNAHDLFADYIIVADSDNMSTTIPSITLGLRGTVSFELYIQTLNRSLHSGMFGGLVPDAMLAGVKLINSFWKEDGSVAVEGLQTVDLSTPSMNEDLMRKNICLPGVDFIGCGTPYSRIWHQPAITITGIDAPNVQNAANMLMEDVRISVSVRIAPTQSPKEAIKVIEKHIRSHTPFGAQVTITFGDSAEGFLADSKAPGLIKMQKAISHGWDAPPVFTSIGGSIPFIADLKKTFNKSEIIITGVEDPDTAAHSPNESQDLSILQKSIASEAIFLADLANLLQDDH